VTQIHVINKKAILNVKIQVVKSREVEKGNITNFKKDKEAMLTLVKTDFKTMNIMEIKRLILREVSKL
jgi:hypothetical protein